MKNKLSEEFMNKVMLIILLVFCVLAISSCQIVNGAGQEKMSGTDVPIEEFNEAVELIIYPGMRETHKNGEMLAFLVRNKSDKTIVFNKDFGSLIYIKSDNEWIQVTNNLGYTDDENILPINDVDPTGLILAVKPDVGDLQGDTLVRIVVIGHVIEKPAEQVGAYIDVLYEP